MLTDRRIPEKLGRIEARYEALRFRKVADVAVDMGETREHFRAEPGRGSGVRWTRVTPPTAWGGDWVTAWFRGTVALPKACAGQRVFVRARTGAETLFWVNGETRGVFDGNHPVVMAVARGRAGQTLHLALEAYAGHSFPGTQPHDSPSVVRPGCRTFEGVELAVENEDVSAFVFDLRTVRQLAEVLDGNSLRKHRLLRAMAAVYGIVDAMPQETGEASWRPKLAQAREVLRPLLESHNGPTVPWLGIVGHSHIDTAWLWPLAETWRKCARTFSSVLNLMEQYPELVFTQSAPCHTDVVRREYPELYERIRRAVAAGHWEPNGAMWVEPDCNIPSGEALVRQLLVGQQATREMFGYTSDTLWLPDVFGYSAALPQILRGAGVEFFCTTKIAWNDTTRFPYDTFVWKGIDGTPVTAHYNAIHCWPDPQTLTHQWNWVQHKDIQDRRLCAFGYGDGGGGPMAEMCEMARRVTDLEGCPQARYTTVGEFMRGIRDDLPGLPEWVGELYLELHRGTLTSVAGIKRGNRRAELALREAEFLCTLAGLRGAEYPRQAFEALWKNLLTNQFHDILPGSSIAEVNDAAVVALEQCTDDARDVGQTALRGLAPAPSPAPAALLVVNSLSWDRQNEIVLDAAKPGTVPALDGVKHQWFEDLQGRPRLAVCGLPVPALGAAVLPLRSARDAKPTRRSPFTLRGRTVETPHALARFDATGRIVSLVDKASGREVVRPGGALNTLLLGEDVPAAWDNWDVDSDQALKMVPANRPVDLEVVAVGPLQLRLRLQHAIGAGTVVRQDVVFHAESARIDFETEVDWRETHRLLKAGFDLALLADTARHEIQYGHAERPTHRNLPQDAARFEVCAHKWTDLSEAGFGIALLNDSKYGVSVRGTWVGLSLLKSGTHPDARGDRGVHHFTYSLLPHACGFSVPAVVRPAYELNVPVTAVAAGARARGLDSLAQVDAPNVIVEAVKWVESGRGFVLRLYEAERTGCRVAVHLGVPVRAVSATNLLEEDGQALELDDGTVTFAMRPFEIKTLVCGIR